MKSVLLLTLLLVASATQATTLSVAQFGNQPTKLVGTITNTTLKSGDTLNSVTFSVKENNINKYYCVLYHLNFTNRAQLVQLVANGNVKNITCFTKNYSAYKAGQLRNAHQFSITMNEKRVLKPVYTPVYNSK